MQVKLGKKIGQKIPIFELTVCKTLVMLLNYYSIIDFAIFFLPKLRGSFLPIRTTRVLGTSDYVKRLLNLI